MKSYSSLVLFASVFMLVGCSIRIGMPPSHHPCPPVPECSSEVESDLDARIAAAKTISSFTKRDRALSVIAVDAARECDIYHTVKALSMISSFTERDSTAEKCADVFLEKRMHKEAYKIADKVSSFVTRDRILSKIAQTPATKPTD